MGVGAAKGADKAQVAAMAAISSPLLETSITGATGVLVSITASEDIQLDEIDIASQMIYEEADPEANIIWGAAFDPSLHDEMRVTIIATGFDANGKENAIRPAATVEKATIEEAPVIVEQTTAPSTLDEVLRAVITEDEAAKEESAPISEEPVIPIVKKTVEATPVITSAPAASDYSAVLGDAYIALKKKKHF